MTDEKWVKMSASDGRCYEIHPDDIEKARANDPGLIVWRDADVTEPRPKPSLRITEVSNAWHLFTLPTDIDPEVDGGYYIGEVAHAKHKNWERLTPYSLAQSRGARPEVLSLTESDRKFLAAMGVAE